MCFVSKKRTKYENQNIDINLNAYKIELFKKVWHGCFFTPKLYDKNVIRLPWMTPNMQFNILKEELTYFDSKMDHVAIDLL